MTIYPHYLLNYDKMLKALLFVPVFLFVQLKFLPNMELLVWISAAILCDFVTGIIKARILNSVRNSTGFRRTITKVVQYFGAIALGIIIGNTSKSLPHADILVPLFGNGLQMLILYIEITSILENMYAIDKESKFSRFFTKPLLNFFTFQIKNNPATQLPTHETPHNPAGPALPDGNELPHN